MLGLGRPKFSPEDIPPPSVIHSQSTPGEIKRYTVLPRLGSDLKDHGSFATQEEANAVADEVGAVGIVEHIFTRTFTRVIEFRL